MSATALASDWELNCQSGRIQLLAWNPSGTILATSTDDMTDEYHSAILWEPSV
jgi:hypothetical protein